MKKQSKNVVKAEIEFFLFLQIDRGLYKEIFIFYKLYRKKN